MARTLTARRLTGACLATLLALSPSREASAEPRTDRRDETVRIALSFFRPEFDTSARADSTELGTGTSLRFENDLGFDTHDSDIRLSGHVGLPGAHRLIFGLEEWERSARKQLERSVKFGDYEYSIAADIESSKSSRFAFLGYRWDFVRRRSVDAGLSVSVGLVQVEMILRGRARDSLGNELDATESVDAESPVPSIGLHADWRVSRALTLRSHAEAFEASSGDWSGRWQAASLELEWMPWRHAGFTAGWRHARIDVLYDGGDIDSAFDQTHSGPLVGLVVSW